VPLGFEKDREDLFDPKFLLNLVIYRFTFKKPELVARRYVFNETTTKR